MGCSASAAAEEAQQPKLKWPGLTQEEKEKIQETAEGVFDQFDTDKSGNITVEELGTIPSLKVSHNG